MQDGQFAMPPITIGQIDLTTPLNTGGGKSPEYRPIQPAQYIPAQGPAGPLQTNPSLYENINIANQSGFTNWWNTFINSWNDTQIGIGASDLMDGLVKKANTQQALNQLDADYKLGKVNDIDYLSKKNNLYDDLSSAYGDINSARSSMYEDEQDKNPISKAFQFKSDISNLRGANASLGDQFRYQLPTALGSSLSLMVPGILAAFGQKAIQGAVSGALSGSVAPGIGNAAGLIVGFGTTLATNLFTRNLETKAEVGSQFLQDYDDLKAKFMQGKSPDYQLTDEDDNQLILQAAKGSDDQYYKNMSLALSDTLQAYIFAGSFNKMLSKFTNLNKFSRIAGQVGAYYIDKKLEGLEEGLQYDWSGQKSLAAQGVQRTQPFFESLLNDYKDVTSSMSFLGIQGNGPFADDTQFQSSVHAGELLGGIFGGLSSSIRIGKDVQAYYATTKELSALNPTKVDDPVFKFKDELYAQFFGPKKSGVLGVLNQDAEDRVFYFKEALKSLNKSRTEEGQPLLTKEELSNELKNVDQAYNVFSEINATLDNIMSPWGKKVSKQVAAQKIAFRNELFNNTMNIMRTQGLVTDLETKVNTGLAGLNDLSQVTAKSLVVNSRIKNAVGNYKEYLDKEKAILDESLKSVKEANKSLNVTQEVEPIGQQVYNTIEKYYDAMETLYDYKKKKEALSKVRSWKDLNKWSEEYKKQAGESFLKVQEEALVEDNKDFAKGLGERPAYNTLNDADKAQRTKDNKNILDRAGYTASFIDTFDPNQLDSEAEKALEDFRKGEININNETMLGLIYNAESKDELLNYLSRPSIRAAFNKLGFDINDNFDHLRAQAEAKLLEYRDQDRKNKVRQERPRGLQINSRNRIVTNRTKDKADSRNTEDYQRNFGIRTTEEGQVASQKDVLEGIIASPYSTEADKELARKFLSITKDETIIFRDNWQPINRGSGQTFDSNGQPTNGNYDNLVRKPATYNGDNNEVVLDLGHFGDEFQGNQFENLAPSFEATILHELTHRYTVLGIQADPKVAEDLDRMLMYAKDNSDGRQYYGLTNIQEFLSEAFTSPDFQKFLASLEGDGYKNLWRQFIDLIGQVLKQAFGIEIQGSLLEDVIAVGTRIIDKGTFEKRVNVVGVLDEIKKDALADFQAIKFDSKTLGDDLESAYNKYMDRIINAVNDNNLGDSVKKELIGFLTSIADSTESRLHKQRQEAKEVYFQGKKFEKGKYVVISGYAEPYWISGFNELSLEVRSKDSKTKINITNSAHIEFQGSEGEADYFIKQRDEERTDYSEPNEFYKSVEQEFERDPGGKLVENSDPVVVRFDNFVKFLFNRNLSKIPYRGLLVQDDDEIAGFAIPREKKAQEALASGKAKRGQVVVVVDEKGNPVKFDENFVPHPNGEYVVFNIELPRSILARSSKVIADRMGISIQQANELKKKVAGNIAAARKSASEGKPVFLDFNKINPGERREEVSKQISTKPLDSIAAARVISIIDLISRLDPNKNKEAIQKAKDFLYNYIIGVDENAKVSGGQIQINGEVVTPTEDILTKNFRFKNWWEGLRGNQPYDILDVSGDDLVVSKTFPSYTDYISSVSDLGSTMSRERYNGYIEYEIKEIRRSEPKQESNPETKIDEVKPDNRIFPGNLYDSSIGEEEPEKQFSNDLGLFDNKTTLDLVKSLDKGLHNYLRRTKTTTIVEAMEDADFQLKALDEIKFNINHQLNVLKETRKSQLDNGKVTQAWYDKQIASIDDKINKLDKNWPEIVNYYRANSYVFAFKKDISYKYDENGNLVQAGDDRTVGTLKGFDTVGNEVSPIDGASKESKALIRGLSKYKKVGNSQVRVANSWNVPELVNFASTWNNLLKNLQGTSTFEEMLERIDNLADRFKEYVELAEILRDYLNKAKEGHVQSLIMVAKFVKDFINPEVPVIQTLMSIENGVSTFKVDEATRKNVKDLKKAALDYFLFKSPYAATTSQGNKVLNPKILNLQTVTKKERADFLKHLGIELSETTLNDPQFDKVASQQIIRFIKEEIRALNNANYLIKDPIADLSSGRITKMGVGKRLNDILDLESKYNEVAPTLSMQNVEGNTEYAISRPNGYSTVIKALNDTVKYPNFQALVGDSPFSYLNFSYARTSHILNMMFVLDSMTNFGSRRLVNGKPITISLTNISGLEIEGGEGRKTTSMFIGDKVVQDFNQLLKSGFKELTRAGDKNSAFGIKLSTYIQPKGTGTLPISGFQMFEGVQGYGGEQMKSIMTSYLKGEIMRVILARQGEFANIRKMDQKSDTSSRFFSLFTDILSDPIKNEIYSKIDALPTLEPNSDEMYFQADVIAKDFMGRTETLNNIKSFFFNEVKKKQESLNKYGFTFSDRFWLDKQFQDVDKDTLLRAYIVNEFIIHTEQGKLFNGDVLFYSLKDGDYHKRTPSSGATGIIPITDRWFVDAMNANPNTNLQAKNLGIDNKYSNIIKTVIFKESQPRSIYINAWVEELAKQGVSKDQINRIVNEYKKGSKEADAQGWITMDYYRSFKISIGDWRLEQEKIYDKISKGEALDVKEVESLGRLFPPIKAQYAGPTVHPSYHVPAFDKFSLMPLLPSMIKGTSLQSLNERMIRNNISYALMESGSKLGVIGTELEDFYQNRNTRTMPDPTSSFSFENLKHVHYLKEQVQIEPELHEEVIYGTQFRKLLFQNVYSNGEPINKKIAALENEYSRIIEEITDYEKERLIEDMGVVPVMSVGEDLIIDYQIKDQTKLLNRIKEEIVRRKLNNSIKDFFEVVDGKLKYPLDASINHQQVRTLVLSMMNNRLIRQTIKGDMMVQGSSLGFEKFDKIGTDDALEYGTNGLRFYHVKDGKVQKMQVKVALTGDFKHLLNFDWKGQKIGTLDKLNQALKDKEWVNKNTKAITMIGYRIPTQGLNSIEAMEIAEFLPPEAGNILIVPTEIVTKAGSDFDIDKLNIFKPSLSTFKGEGRYVERSQFIGTKKAREIEIKEDFDKKINDLKAQKKAYRLFDSLGSQEKDQFFEDLKNKLEIVDSNIAEQLGDLGLSIRELRQRIDTLEGDIKALESEISTSFDPDKFDQLTGDLAGLYELRIYLADEIDRKEQLKKNLLLQKFQNQEIPKAEEVLKALQDNLASNDKSYNDSLINKINTLNNERSILLEEARNYKAGLFNAIIEVAIERLTDIDAFTQLITPNSTDLIKPKVQEVASKTGSSKKVYKNSANLTSSTQEEKFLAGIPNKQALGIAAVANTFSQLFDKVNQGVNDLFKGRSVVHPMIDKLNMADIVLKNKVLKSEIISQMINAYVDVLNDDFISKANLSLDTAGTFFYLLHLGHDHEQLVDFFNHPVIKKYISEIQKNKSIIRQEVEYQRGEITNKEKVQKGEDPIEDLDKYISNKAKRNAFLNSLGLKSSESLRSLKETGLDNLNKDMLSAESLKEAVGKPLDNFSITEKQAILSYYLNVIEESTELLNLQQVNNYDTTTSVNPVVNEFREALKSELEEKALFKKLDVTSSTVIKPFNQFALISKILDTLMPITLNSDIRKAIVDLTKDLKNVDQDKLVRTFINDWIQFLAFNFGETSNGEKLGLYGKRLLMKGENQLVNQLLDFKLNEKWNNLRYDFPIINALRADVTDQVGNIILYRDDNSSDYQNSVIEQLQNMAELDDFAYNKEDTELIRKFAKDLMVLGFAQSGLNKSPISFSDLIPNEYYAPMMAKALEAFTSLPKDQQRNLFIRFSAMFRGINTQIMGNKSNVIPYWRYKDYTLPDTGTKLAAQSGDQLNIFDTSIDIPNGTYDTIIKGLYNDGKIQRRCE